MKPVKSLFKSIGTLVLIYFVSIVIALTYAVIKVISTYHNEMSQEEITTNILAIFEQDVLVIVGITNLIILALLFLVCLFKKQSFKKRYSFKSMTNQQIYMSFAIAVAGVFLSIGINGSFDMASLDPSGYEVTQNLLDPTNFALSLLIVGLFVPIVEELLFRGVIYRSLKENMPIVPVILLQAFFFGLYHMNLLQGISAFFIAINAGLALYYTGSIWAPIIIHIVNNSIAVILSNKLPSDMEFSHFTYVSMLVFGTVLSVLLQFYLHKKHANYSESDQVDQEETATS